MTHAPWVLFLDDIRNPPSTSTVVLARSVAEALELIALHGAPHKVHFDHDLGEDELTGFDFAKILVERDLDSQGTYLPFPFKYVIHSANLPGSENIKGLLDGYLTFKRRHLKKSFMF